MNVGRSKSSSLIEIFSGLNELRKEPWRTLWIDRLIQYGFFFICIFLIGILLFWILGSNLIPTDIDNARYFLSAMVQAQAAIVTLVITLTLIAIQMASASYTPRVVDVMKKNPDMWYLLIIYICAMSYGFIALKLVTDPDRFLVSSVLILGVYTFCILFLYMKNTIKLLRPDAIIKMLVNEINAENIHQEGWKKESEDDIMQPVFDIVHASISRFDVTTTRTGLNVLSDRILELFFVFDKESREKKTNNIAEHFCKHIRRSALIALRNDDEGMLNEISKILQKFGIGYCDYQNSVAVDRVSNTLAFIGTRAADKELEGATMRVAISLGVLGSHAADRKLGNGAWAMAESLGVVGTHAANKKLKYASWRVAFALGDVGTHAADKELENVTVRVADLMEIVGIRVADEGLEDATSMMAETLATISFHVTDKKFKDATRRVAEALEVIGSHAADRNLKDSTWRVVHVLCRLGLREFGQNDAAKSLAQLLFNHKNTITELIKKFESEFKPEPKDRFTIFINVVNEELNILKPILL